MMNYLSILLMASPQGGGSSLTSLLPVLLIGVVFYFFMIRPQAKKMKDQRNFIENLKKGDKVVTIGGIHGKIMEVNADHLLIEIDTDVKVKCEKSSVSLEASKNLNKDK